MRTIKVEITQYLSDSDKDSILETIADSARVFSHFALLGNQRQSTSYVNLHKHGYDIAKTLSPNLPTAILQQTAKTALASIKSWNSNLPRTNSRRKKYNIRAKKNGWKEKPILGKWEYEGEKRANSYPVNKLSLTRRGNLTSFSSSNHRIRIMHDIPAWFGNRYPNAKLQAGNIVAKNGQYWLNLVYEVDTNGTPRGNDVVGIDRGVNNIVATSQGKIISSEQILKIRARYLHNRKQLQQKGTRSAKRRLKKQSGREKRFMLDKNHCITKQLASDNTVSTYVLEDLTGIREQRRNRNMNRLLSSWAFLQFEFQLKYKCELNGINVAYVDPRYTSQKCSVCKTVDKTSRQDDIYHCAKCGFTANSDINSSVNIRDNYLGRIQPSNRNGAV